MKYFAVVGLYVLAFFVIAGMVSTTFYFIRFGQVRIPLEGAILRIDGSTTIYPFTRRAADAYTKAHPETGIVVLQSSTGEGIAALLAGDADIADATRLPTDEERARAQAAGNGLVVTPVGRDAVVVATHPSKGAAVEALTVEQLRKIFFTGEITDWSQLSSGLNGPIHVYVRDPFLSGTANLFAEEVTGSGDTPYLKTVRNIHITPLVVPTVAEDPDGIAYSPLEWVDASVHVVRIGQDPASAVAPTPEAIRDGSYPLTRKMYVVTRGASTALTRSFLDFLTGEEGKKILREVGFQLP